VTPSVDRHPSRPAHSLSPNFSLSPRRSDADSPISERILSLVTTLSERVQHLESRLEGGSEPKKRLATEEATGEHADTQSNYLDSTV